MGVLRCCDDESESVHETTTVAARPTFARRARELAGWIVPAAGLALVPKCPACLAAYLAIGTGVGVSVPTATYLRMAMLIAFVASLSYLAVKRALQVKEWKHGRQN
jgi:hypothetical protein